MGKNYFNPQRRSLMDTVDKSALQSLLGLPGLGRIEEPLDSKAALDSR